ncbi:MAG TPA: c-type cytochrome, partial [Chitinophagaceae bacterium]|nr:c-type cytochrome [Chitinophagaceae bacterium]
EYKLSVLKAEKEVAEYMKNSANNVDETTVKLLTDKADLTAGRELYMNNCAACHGRAGEGTVGPNLTDEYWLHSGGVKDIFKTIKYGWPDQGMKAWKDDFSPVQIAQLTSFIKSLSGSNPPNAKAKQGEIYTEELAPGDSAITSKDSLKTIADR